MTRSNFYIHMIVGIIQYNIYVCNKSDYKIVLTILSAVHGAGLGSVTTLVRFELVGRIIRYRGSRPCADALKDSTSPESQAFYLFCWPRLV